MYKHKRRTLREEGGNKNTSRESQFTAKSGFVFNIDAPIWEIDRKKTLTICRLDSLALEQRELSDLKYAFAILARTIPYGSLNKYLSGILNCNIKSLTPDGVVRTKTGITESQFDSLKALARELKKIDRENYTSFHDAVY